MSTTVACCPYCATPWPTLTGTTYKCTNTQCNAQFSITNIAVEGAEAANDI